MVLNNRLAITDLIDGQYIFRLKDNSEPPAIVNLADIKKAVKPMNIELWYLCMGYLGYRNLKTLKNLSNGMDFKDTAPKKLCKNCEKSNQTCQLSKIPISQSTEFLNRVHSDLDRSFLQTKQGYKYYIFF